MAEGERLRHARLPEIRRALDAPKPVTVGEAGHTWRLLDPARDPAEILVLLNIANWQVLNPDFSPRVGASGLCM